jgi:hypothetical protein
MTRKLPTTDAGQDVIQFRGPQTSVTHDGTGVHFGTEHRHDQVAHRAYPVVDPDADPDDVPDHAVARPVAEQLVEQSPLVCWGVACEHVDANGVVCGEVFETPRGEASHYGSVHGDADASGADQDDESTETDDQSVGDTEAGGGEA